MICHTCDNPPCVNPSHLWLGTAWDNQIDKTIKGRCAQGPTHGSRTRPERKPQGARHYKTKLNAEQVREIRHLAAETTLRYQDIGERYGITRNVVGNIVRRENWKSVP
jgi:hypothetical protein